MGTLSYFISGQEMVDCGSVFSALATCFGVIKSAKEAVSKCVKSDAVDHEKGVTNYNIIIQSGATVHYSPNVINYNAGPEPLPPPPPPPSVPALSQTPHEYAGGGVQWVHVPPPQVLVYPLTLCEPRGVVYAPPIFLGNAASLYGDDYGGSSGASIQGVQYPPNYFSRIEAAAGHRRRAAELYDGPPYSPGHSPTGSY